MRKGVKDERRTSSTGDLFVRTGRFEHAGDGSPRQVLPKESGALPAETGGYSHVDDIESQRTLDEGDGVIHRGKSSRSARVVLMYTVPSIVIFLGAWMVISWRVSTNVLPTPIMAVNGIVDYHHSGDMYSDMLTTSKRIAFSFVLSLTASIAIGVALGTSRHIEKLFGSWVTVMASVPSLLYLVISYLWLGISDQAAIVGAAFVVAPSMIFNVWQGMRGLDADLLEMGRAFGVPQATRIRRIMLPQTLPFVFAAARLGLALTWKIMIFAELLGRSSGVGYRIQFWYNLFNMERVLAAAIPFMTLMILIEFGVLRPLERWLFRWRRAEAK